MLRPNPIKNIELDLSWKTIKSNGPLTFFAVALMSVLYVTSNRAGSLRPAIENTIAIDRSIPFIPESAWIYFAALLICVAGLLAIKNKRHFYWISAVNAVSFFLNYVLWLIIPITFPRNELHNDSFTHLAYETLTEVDLPTNCFPSGHVTLMCLLAWVGINLKSRLGTGAIVTAILGTLSIFTTKQHSIADAIGGASSTIVAFIVVQIAFIGYQQYMSHSLTPSRPAD